DRAFFFASTHGTGLEPWVSDGTAEGTHLIRDIVPGPGGSGPISDAERLSGRVVDGRFVFRTGTGALWLSNPEATDGSHVGLNGEVVVSEIGTLGSRFLVIARATDRSALWMIDPSDSSQTMLRRFEDAATRDASLPFRAAQFTEFRE